MTAYVTAEEIEQFAISTQSLYETHVRYGQKRAGLDRWRSHLQNRVWNLFKREMKGNPIIMTDSLNKAAAELRTYYLQHAAEIAKGENHE